MCSTACSRLPLYYCLDSGRLDSASFMASIKRAGVADAELHVLRVQLFLVEIDVKHVDEGKLRLLPSGSGVRSSSLLALSAMSRCEPSGQPLVLATDFT